MTKTLVLYMFHVYNDRVKNFLDKCIFYDESVDFIIISSDKANIFAVPSIVKVLFRDNVGFDFGGWSDALITGDLYKNYERFVFINSSVIGPFIPSYYKGRWTDIYLNGLKDNVKLFGSTINTCQNPYLTHVQSYVFAMDKEALEYLIECNIFSMKHYANTMNEAIHTKEIAMSRRILERGWNIGSLLPYYNGVDFTFKNKIPEECGIMFLDDVMYPQYRNVLWSEYQLVFIKGNRGIL